LSDVGGAVIAMTRITITREQVDEMLAQSAKQYGYTLEELRSMARDGSLSEPELRDLWIIWGDEPLNASSD